IYKRQDWWKKLFLTQCNPLALEHTVPLMLSQLDSLKIPRIPRVVMGHDEVDADFVREQLGDEDYILLHPFTRQAYKYWPARHWAQLADLIQRQTGLRAIFTRSGFAADEQQFQGIEAAAGR